MQFIDLKAQYAPIASKIRSRIDSVLEHGQYIMGPELHEFEAALASYVGVKHAVCVSSGTDALLLALMALDIQPGDEVITTPFSFFATAEVIEFLKAVPVFVDIEPDTYNINAELIEGAITPKTRAIMPVSLYGQCADMDRINHIAEKHQLAVIEDAAQSFGALYNNKRSGGLSTIGCTSFFPSKPLGCYGDGGACFTDDEQLAQRLKEARNHGQGERYLHTSIGINGRMDTIQAAILLEKLAIFDKELALRETVAKRYHRLLASLVTLPVLRENRTNVYAQYTMEVSDREAIKSILQEKGIPTAVHYPISMHLQPALAHLDYKEGDFPIAEAASKRVMSLPMHPYLTEQQQEEIVRALQKALEEIHE